MIANEVFLVISIHVNNKTNYFDIMRQNGISIPNLQDEQFRSFLSGVFSSLCHKVGIRILRSEYFKQEDNLALIMHADASDTKEELDVLRHMLELAGNKLHVTVKVQREDLFRYMHRI